jgi:hypothetical protein
MAGTMRGPDALRARRDAKARPHLAQYAPVWLVDDQAFPDDEAIQFNVVFQHSLYGWVNRRYRYDGFNDVLYYKGQRVVEEDRALAYQAKAPYIAAEVADIPNNYGG